MIIVNRLKKYFQGPKRGLVKAVDDVTFEVYPGEIFGLLGANGAGKTTLLRMLSTVIKPTAGSATIDSHDITLHPEEVRKKIGFMSTTTALYSRLTAKEMIDYIGSLYDIPNDELKQRSEKVIDLLEINEFQDRLCDKLSTGQKQRVSLARTILHDPPVLFFDEPTAGLDVLASKTIMEFVEKQKLMGKTVVFSTHIMSEAERLCDRVCVIHAGKVAGIGTLDELRQITKQDALEKVFLKLIECQEPSQ